MSYEVAILYGSKGLFEFEVENPPTRAELSNVARGALEVFNTVNPVGMVAIQFDEIIAIGYKEVEK
jgi:hypothetical protein